MGGLATASHQAKTI